MEEEPRPKGRRQLLNVLWVAVLSSVVAGATSYITNSMQTKLGYTELAIEILQKPKSPELLKDWAIETLNLGVKGQDLQPGNNEPDLQLTFDDIKASSNCRLLRTNGELTAAKEACTGALNLNPRNVWALAMRCGILTMLKDYGGAEKDCERAIELSPNYADVYLNKGFLAEHRHDYAGALENFKLAVKYDRSSYRARNNVAWLEATCDDPVIRDPVSALHNARRSLELSPKRRFQLLETLAAAYAANGDFNAALIAIKEAQLLKPTDEKLDKHRRLIESAKLIVTKCMSPG